MLQKHVFIILLSIIALFPALNACAQSGVAALPETEIVNGGMGNVSINAEEVVIQAIKGTDLYTDTKGRTHSDNTPRLLFVPKGDFEFSAKVSANLSHAYEGGALLIYSDENMWGKLLFEQFRSGQYGVASTVTKGAGDDAYHGYEAVNSIYLKISRIADEYRFFISNDGEEWHYKRAFNFISKEPVKVGFTAQAPLSEVLIAHFSEIVFQDQS